MHALTALDLLNIWERGEGLHSVDRALTLLVSACPEMSWNELTHLSIGERDTLLLILRELTLGRRLDGVSVCPACGERLEFSLDITDLQHGAGDNILGMNTSISSSGTTDSNVSEQAALPEGFLEVEGVAIRFRLPNSLDLAAIAGCTDTTAGRELLLQRCLLQARKDEVEIATNALPSSIYEKLVAQMSACQPAADLILELDCPNCSHRWSTILDIASFFWAEVTALARQLLREVHVLARSYGWTETDILAMSANRRALYLELVGE